MGKYLALIVGETTSDVLHKHRQKWTEWNYHTEFLIDINGDHRHHELKKNINFTLMKTMHELKTIKYYKIARALASKDGIFEPWVAWPDFYLQEKKKERKPNRSLLNNYSNQWQIRKITSYFLTILKVDFFCPYDDFLLTEEEFLKKHCPIGSGIVTYAYCDKNVWVENSQTSYYWRDDFLNYLKTIPNDECISVVTCRC